MNDDIPFDEWIYSTLIGLTEGQFDEVMIRIGSEHYLPGKQASRAERSAELMRFCRQQRKEGVARLREAIAKVLRPALPPQKIQEFSEERSVAPQHINNVTDRYIPLPCVVCGRDLLRDEGIDKLGGIIGFIQIDSGESVDTTHGVYVACKGRCDHAQERLECSRWKRSGQVSVSWREVSELTNPWLFVSLVTGVVKQSQEGSWKFTQDGAADFNKIIYAVAQAVCRPSSDRERQAAINDLELARRVPGFGA